MNHYRNYILNDKGEPVSIDCSTDEGLKKWGESFSIDTRRVAETTIGPYWISTVFLGLDHNWSAKGPPILWETMVFYRNPNPDRRGEDLDMDRCSGTREQAEAMHERMVKKVKRNYERRRKQPTGRTSTSKRKAKTGKTKKDNH